MHIHVCTYIYVYTYIYICIYIYSYIYILYLHIHIPIYMYFCIHLYIGSARDDLCANSTHTKRKLFSKRGGAIQIATPLLNMCLVSHMVVSGVVIIGCGVNMCDTSLLSHMCHTRLTYTQIHILTNTGTANYRALLRKMTYKDKASH